MRTPEKAQSVIVGIFDDPQYLDLTVLRLASEDSESTQLIPSQRGIPSAPI